ncbi:MAG: hypothetical protein Q9212_000012 [Teloschistes hypoglaucus]
MLSENKEQYLKVRQNIAVRLSILRGFEFLSQLRRASVLVSQAGDKDVNVYVKGAPECMKDIYRGPVPIDYQDLLDFYTQRGFRVIACATKQVPFDWTSLQKMERDEAERGLDFIGFIIFENKLKPATAETIGELKAAGIRQVMCTGDNILTAISVARECALIDRMAHCFVPRFTEDGPRNSSARLKWQSVDNPLFELDERTLMPLPPPADGDVSLPYDMSNLRNYTLAVTGDVFRWTVDFGEETVLRRMLVTCQIFARMSPDEKHELVEKLQALDHCCGFCGDGANDCGALKAADVGISLSEAEASVAAPFTSQVFDISCVPEVIREGRAALVTSFCCFKYMSLYSAIQFTSQNWFLPPVLEKERSNIENSENTALFLTSCFQYILSAIVLSIGPPFRQSMTNNSESLLLPSPPAITYTTAAPLVVVVVMTLLFSIYMLFDPAAWLTESMQLTYMTVDFRCFIVALAFGGFVCAWLAERKVFLWAARIIGKLHGYTWPHRRKKRKQYKVLQESMRM